MMKGKANVWGEDASKHYRLRPDTPAVRRLYEALRAGDYDA
jgi:hypothetical protein